MGGWVIIVSAAYAETEGPVASESQTEVTLDEVDVAGVKHRGFIEEKTIQPRTETTVTKEGIQKLGGPAQTSIYQALRLLPSVTAETADPYGLNTRTPFNFRVRGQAGIGTSMTVEGVPVWAQESPGPRPDIFDMENLDRLTLYRGAIAPEKGLGAQNIAGNIDLGIRRPEEKFGVDVRQTFGAFDMQRTFARIDSGTLPTGTRLFASYSYTSADKWRGEGGAPDFRHHVSFGASQEISKYVKADLFFDYNQSKQNAFRPLTFAQVRNLDTARDLDYNPRLTGTAAQDVNFYNFNRDKITDYSAFSLITIKPNFNHTFVIKPYYWAEDLPRYTGVGNLIAQPAVRQRTSDFDRYGMVLQYDTELWDTHIKLGYWYEQFSLPIAEKIFRLQNGNLVFSQWLLTKFNGNGVIHSPYVKLGRDFGKLHVDAGLRYLSMYNPGVTGFNNAGIPNVSYDQALASNPAKDSGSSYSGITNDAFLPHVGLNYSLTEKTNVYLTYGKNYASPRGYPELQSLFANNRVQFTAAGLTLQNVVDRIKLATSQNVDLGLRYTSERFYVAPVLFYTEYNNLLARVIDPGLNSTSINISVGSARSYGGEFETGVTPLDNLSLYASLMYAKSQFTENTQSATGAVIRTNGKETPDFPKIMVKAGASYKVYGLEIAPVVRYLGSRYGDVANTEKVSPYTIVDLFLTYSNPQLFQKLPGVKDGYVSLMFLNLFDKKYVSVINAFDDSLGGGSAYFPGAPFTVAGSVGLKF